MDWDKAKNLAIIFLFVLNAVLILLININSEKYTITSEQESAIIKTLGENKVTVSAKILGDYKPRPQIILNPPSLDQKQLINAFFGSDKVLTETQEFERNLFIDEKTGDTLTIFNDRAVFEKGEAGENTYNLSELNEICGKFIESNSEVWGNLVLDSPNIYEDSDIYRIEYRQKYENTIIYNNYVIFTCTKNGIQKIDYCYKEPQGLDEKNREIISPDVAMFLFMQHLLSLYRNREVNINQIDIIYYQNESSDKYGEPCYRFYIEGTSRPFLINAYTGVNE